MGAIVMELQSTPHNDIRLIGALRLMEQKSCHNWGLIRTNLTLG